MKNSYRKVVIKILSEIEDGVLLNQSLDKNVYSIKTVENKGLINNIVRGVLEYKIGLDEVIQKFIRQDIHSIDNYILNILRAAIYELYILDKTKTYATVNEYVDLVKFSKLKRLTGFTNAVLRNILRTKSIKLKPSYPSWLIKLLKVDYGSEITEKIVNAKNNHDVSFRIIDEAILDKLKTKYTTKVSGIVDNCILISDISSMSEISEFNDGKITVQDAGSIVTGNICKGLLHNLNEPLILDLCAAPGGKSIHIAEVEGSKIIACDINESKINKIRENINRMHVNNIDCKINDALNLNEAFIDKFDLVLCDLPCSGLGLMLKKPDIRYRIKAEDINILSLIQRKILSNAIKYVKRGGYLVFSTCTITKKENIENFKYLKNELNNIKIEGKEYLQYLQGIDNCDGFFISVFRK